FSPIHLSCHAFASASCRHDAAEIFCEQLFRNFIGRFKYSEFPAMNPTRPGGDIRLSMSIGIFSEASMRRYGFALLFAASAAVSGAGVASAGTPYDGRWSVVIQTSRGNCDQAYRYGLNIVNGNVTYGGGGGFDVRGRVAHNGAVHVRVSSGGSYADGSGRLS